MGLGDAGVCIPHGWQTVEPEGGNRTPQGRGGVFARLDQAVAYEELYA